MTRTDLYGTVFVFSRESPPPDGYFQGYCFVGSDLVFGSDGAAMFQEETGQRLRSGRNGRYVTVEKHEDTYIFGGDYAGYSVLYYYHDGSEWAVSNSFASIVDHLRELNIPISPNYAQLSAIGARGMVMEQLFSLETLARDVRVVPRTHNLIIEPHRAGLELRAQEPAAFEDYESALGGYLHTWVSRFETLMLSEKAQFTVDLTGGVDSRTNFALVLGAQRRLGDSARLPRLRCGAGGNTSSDLEVATAVSGHFGLPINGRFTTPPVNLQGDESFMMYRALSLGVYYPLYFPKHRPSVQDITIGGGGGGIHRKLYELTVKSPDPDYFFKAFARNMRRPEFEQELVRDAHRFLGTTLVPGDDPLRTLLREGRVRYHSGHIPRTRTAFTPLHSADADQAQALAGATRIEEGQFNYDIMHSLDPELVMMPYDSEEKLPGPDVRARLSSSPIPPDANPGKVWAASTDPQGRDEDSSDPLDPFAEAFETAVNNPFAIKFLRKDMLADAKAVMEKLRSGKSIGNASNGKPISAVLSADLVTPD